MGNNKMDANNMSWILGKKGKYSEIFLNISGEVQDLITDSAELLLQGRADVTARRIVQRLTDRYGFEPKETENNE